MLSKVCGAAALSDQYSRLHPRIPQAVVQVLCISLVHHSGGGGGRQYTANCRRHALPTGAAANLTLYCALDASRT